MTQVSPDNPLLALSRMNILTTIDDFYEATNCYEPGWRADEIKFVESGPFCKIVQQHGEFFSVLSVPEGRMGNV